MLKSDPSEKYVTGPEFDDLFPAIGRTVHVHPSVEHGKDLLSIVDMPLVRLVSPVHPRGDAVHVRHVDGPPRPTGCELLAADHFPHDGGAWLRSMAEAAALTHRLPAEQNEKVASYRFSA